MQTFININNNIRCEWTGPSDQASETVRLNKKEREPAICYLQEIQFRFEGINRLKEKGW